MLHAVRLVERTLKDQPFPELLFEVLSTIEPSR
jgi:hypothetical protein